MIIVYILTAQSAAGLDIRVGIILKQYKVNADYLNLPIVFLEMLYWRMYPRSELCIKFCFALLDYVHDRKRLLGPP